VAHALYFVASVFIFDWLDTGTIDNNTQPLASVRRTSSGIRDNSDSSSAAAYRSNDEKCVDVLFLGIIDFLQDWNFKKHIAMTIKACERNKSTVRGRFSFVRFIWFSFHSAFVLAHITLAAIPTLLLPCFTGTAV
jgi:hypothetical protein